MEMKKDLNQAIKFEQFDEYGVPHTRHAYGGHTWELVVLGDESFSLLCLDPAVDDEGVDQTRGPDDSVVSDWAGVAVEFSDRGDDPDYPEAIYRRKEIDMDDISRAAAALGRKGGSARSEAKTAAVRENGRKGGRPKKPSNTQPRFAPGLSFFVG